MSASPSAGPLADEVIDGRYTIERQLGEGGMGTVFLARHRITGRRVALKFVQSGDKSLRQRLLREARAIAKVAHPSVVDVLDAGEHGDGVYIALEYLSGNNLRGHVSGRTLAPALAVQLLMPALEGVAAAHQAGILHRDLKPENLFVCIDADGGVFDTKVLDFGISKQVLGPTDEQPKQTALTQQGHIVGTPEYMAPEQIAHEPVLDERTDVYAMGLVMYELLAGRLPYETRELRALLLDIVRGELPSPSRYREELPPELCKVVMKALATEPSKRFESIAAFARALEPWSDGRTFEPPRKIGSAHDVAHNARTVHRSGAVAVERTSERAWREPSPPAAISTVTGEAEALAPSRSPSGPTREERSLRPKKRRESERSEAALAATMPSQSLRSGVVSSASPPVPVQKEFKIAVAVLLAVIVCGLGYAWFLSRPRQTLVIEAATDPAFDGKPARIAPVAAPAPAAALPAAPPTAASPPASPEAARPPEPELPAASEPARASSSRRKRAPKSAEAEIQPAASQEPKTVEVKTRAGTFGKKDF